MIKYYDQAMPINIFEEVKYCNFVAFIHHLWRLPPHTFEREKVEYVIKVYAFVFVL